MTTAFEVAPDLSIAAARRRMAKAFAAAGIDTPDLDARLRELAAQGVLPRTSPCAMTLEPWGRVRIAAIRTPDGAVLELMQRA